MLKDLNISVYRRIYLYKIGDGDNVRLLAKMSLSEVIALHALLEISKAIFNTRFYIYGGYQILNGMMADFYSIDLNDQVEKFDWVPVTSKG